MYSPVIHWSTIHLFMTLSLTQCLVSRQIDFILAYPHTNVETLIYLELPPSYKNFLAANENPNDSLLLLKKNVYGLKQASRTWFEFLCDHHWHAGSNKVPTTPVSFTRVPLPSSSMLTMSLFMEPTNKNSSH